jgi:hypothetical protein
MQTKKQKTQTLQNEGSTKNTVLAGAKEYHLVEPRNHNFLLKYFDPEVLITNLMGIKCGKTLTNFHGSLSNPGKDDTCVIKLCPKVILAISHKLKCFPLSVTSTQSQKFAD